MPQSVRPPGSDPIFVRYVDQITKLEFFKYDVVVNYFDLRFRYKNLGANLNSTFTLEIKGIVDVVEPKEYIIYSKTKPAEEANDWIVRVPEINNNKIPVWNYGASTYNISKIPIRQYIDGGLNYDINTQDKFAWEGPVSRYLGIYPNIDVQYGDNGGYDIKLTSDPEPGPRFIVTNTAAILADFVNATFYRYGKEYPCILLNYDPPPPTSASPQTEQEYFSIPIGVTKYKITLTNNQNQEKVISYLNGTLYANPAYSPVQQINTTLPPPSASFATLTLNNSQPYPAPSNPNGGPNNNTTVTGFTSGGQITTGSPSPMDMGQDPVTGQGGPGSTSTGTSSGTSRPTTPRSIPGVVPDCIGYSRSACRTAVEDAGFVFRAVTGDDAPSVSYNGLAYSQTPSAGSTPNSNSTVTVTFYAGYRPGSQ